MLQLGIKHEQNDETEVFNLLAQQKPICRFCFGNINKTYNEYFSIYQEEIGNILQFCFGNLITENNQVSVPTLICITCHLSLVETYRFLSGVKASEKIIEKYIKSENSHLNYSHAPALEETVFQGQHIKGIEEDLKCSDEEESKRSIIQLENPKNIRPRKNYKLKKTFNKKRTNKTQAVGPKSIPKIFYCPSCDKKYISSYELQVHIRKHTGEKPFTCKLCEKSFGDERNLKRHKKIHSGEKEHECRFCERKFLHLFSLKNHERTHSGEKPFICEICAKAFTTSSELKIHSRTHSKEKPYSCGVCAKSFSSKAALNIHSKIHTDEKKFQCKICHRKCRTSSDLKVHLRCHSDEKPYVCKYINCDKKYRSSSHLNVHLRTHTGEKLHQCAMCYKKFGEANTLKRHMFTHKKA